MTMTAEAISMLVTGLAGGFGHCIGMCGPLVAAWSFGNTGTATMRSHLLYHLGRITTYTTLGATAGAAGSFLVLASSIGHFQKAVMLLAGLAITLMGMATAGWLPSGKRLKTCTRQQPLLQKIMTLFNGQISAGTCYPMGILLGFLPCGLTLTALLAATRSAMEARNHFEGLLNGALLMLIFGLGTTPALLMVGKATSILADTTRQRLYRLAGLIMIITGLLKTGDVVFYVK